MSEVSYDSNGLPTTVKEYAYGSGSPGSELRRTITTFANYGMPASVTVYDAGGTNMQAQTNYSYDGTTPTATSGVPQHTSVSTARGNLTSVSVWRNTPSAGYLTTTNTFDDTGNLLTTTDPGGHATSISYSSTFANAYPTQVTLPTTSSVSHVVRTLYDSYTGMVRVQCGENFPSGSACDATATNRPDQVTYSYDSMLRITTINYGDGGLTTLTQPTSTDHFLKTEHKIDSSNSTAQWQLFDGYGRVTQVRRSNADSTNPYDVSASCFDSRGRVSKTTYPVKASGWLSDCSGAGTTYDYDPLGRTRYQTSYLTSSTSAVTEYQYAGTQTTLIDPNSKTRRYVVDALGRQTRTAEVVSGSNVWTDYGYDLLGSLTGVTQTGINARSFSYNSLGQLLSATAPEAGTTTFTYDSDGNLYQRTRPKANQPTTASPVVNTTTTYAYDALHRLTSTSYSNSDSSTATATTTLYYDEASTTSPTLTLSRTTGRLSRAIAGSSSTNYNIFSYDYMGRVATNWQTSPYFTGTSKAFYYTYNLLGARTVRSDFWAKAYTSSYDIAARLTGITSNLYNTTAFPQSLISGIKYNANGQPTEYVNGASIGNGVKTTLTYDTPGRLTSKVAVTNGGSGSTIYNLSSVGYNSNGNISSANDGVAWTHSYDDLNRLTTSASSGTTYSAGYDPVGNRTSFTGQTFTHTDNHIDSGNGITYDILGNIVEENDGVTIRKYIYDAENRMTKVTNSGGTMIAEYVYDAFGRRVEKVIGGATDANPTREYFYDLDGKVALEIIGSGTWAGGVWNAEHYAGDMHLSTYAGGVTTFHYQDYLGTDRINADQSGTVTSDCTYGPYGDQRSCTGTSTDWSKISYAGYDWDPESKLFHTWFRQYNPRLGRFMTADPLAGNIGDPQSLNRYAYVVGNPTNWNDPLGLQCEMPDGKLKWDDELGNTDNPAKACQALGGKYSNTPSVTVYGHVGMVPTVFDYLDFYTMWSSGRGPRHINYGPNDGATRDLMGSSIVQDALAEHASKDCKETTNVDSTHRRPFEEGYLLGAAKAMVGEESPNYTLMQVGGFGGEITTSRGITTVRLTNTASASSFWYP
jgi:RHS repeat-associated protein